MRLRLCDDDGMVSHEIVDPPNLIQPDLTYLRGLNNLRRTTGLPPYEGEPFVCTGHAHLAGEHIECTSPAHSSERRLQDAGLTIRSGQGITWTGGVDAGLLRPADFQTAVSI